MMKFSRCYATAISFAFLAATHALGAPLPIAQLHEPPAMALMTLAPNGETLAFRAESAGTQYLATMDLGTMKPILIGKFEDTRLLNVFWKSDDVLMIIVENANGSSEFRSCDLKSGNSVWFADRVRYRSATLLSMLPADPDHVLMQIEADNGMYFSRYNVRNGKQVVIEKPAGVIEQWIVNQQHEPVGAVCSDDRKYFYRWRPAGARDWQRCELGPEDDVQLWPVAARQDGRLLAWDASGPGTMSFVVFDPATRQKEILFQHKTVDPDQTVKWGSVTAADLVGIRYEDDAPRIHFFDPDAAKLQAKIDATLPDTFNEVLSTSRDRSVVLFVSRSDQEPGVFYILNQRSGKMAPLGPVYPGQRKEDMGSSRPFAFKGKDGLSLTGRLLLPPGNPSKPPVILMTGAPLAGPRTRKLFDATQQMFATRGYAVARINHRGCRGFGRAFIKAGDYRFASAMAGDLLAGLDHLIAEGLVDETRVIFFGKHLGGMVGLHALNHTGRFKAWLNEQTVTRTPSLDYTDLFVLSSNELEIVRAIRARREELHALESQDPRPLLAQIQTPSFHVYYRVADHYRNEHAAAIEAYLKKNPSLGKLIQITLDKDPVKARANRIAAAQAMLDFLSQQVPTKP